MFEHSFYALAYGMYYFQKIELYLFFLYAAFLSIALKLIGNILILYIFNSLFRKEVKKCLKIWNLSYLCKLLFKCSVCLYTSRICYLKHIRPCGLPNVELDCSSENKFGDLFNEPYVFNESDLTINSTFNEDFSIVSSTVLIA